MFQATSRILCGPVLILLLAAASTGCGESPTIKADSSARAKVTRVEVVKPERTMIRRSTEQPGQIEAYEVTDIHAKVSGYVQKWNVDIGAKVSKGQVLAVLDDPELDAESEQKQALVEESEGKLAQAKASEEVARANLFSSQAKLAEVQAGIKRATADLARWRAEFQRVEQLFNERAQTGSLLEETRSKLEAAGSARDEVLAQVKTAQAAVRQCEAMIDKARSDVTTAAATIKVARLEARRLQAMREYTTIVAPYNGVITRRNVDVGELTTPGPQGQALFTVARDDIVRISVGVPEMYATEVDPGDRVLIRLQATPGKNFEGKVARTSWTLDVKNRTLRTEIDVPNPKGTLRPGLYAYATIIVEEHAGALTVPSSAVVRQDTQTYCVAVANGKAVRKPVTLGLGEGTATEIVSGLEGNETIVKAYAASLNDGQPVEVVVPEVTKVKS